MSTEPSALATGPLYWLTLGNFSPFCNLVGHFSPLASVLSKAPPMSRSRTVSDVCVGLYLLEVRQRPGPIEVGLGRLVEAEIRKPVLAGHGRDPVLLEAGRRLRPAID